MRQLIHPAWRVPVDRLVASLVIAGAALGLAPLEAAAAPVAVVLERTGVVWVKPADAGQRLLAVLDPLAEGARIEVSKDARAVLFFVRSGQEYTVAGDATVEIHADAPKPLAGPVPTLRVPDPGKEIRLRTDSVVLGGLVMRHLPIVSSARAPPPAPPPCTPLASREEIAGRQPDASARPASRVLFALWLDEMCARDDAQRAWRELARELPFDDAIRQRIR